MTYFWAQCPDHGTVLVELSDVRLHLDADGLAYLFPCPRCRRSRCVYADGPTSETLQALGSPVVV